MPLRMTMGAIVDRCKRLADLKDDDSLADSDEWKPFIDLVYGEMWPEVSMGAQKRYFETSTTISADGSASYDEPTDHFATVRIVRVVDDHEIELRELRQGEEAAYKSLTGDATAFTHVDDLLFLYPAPSSGTYKWYYQQQPTDLSEYADADVVDLVVPAGKRFVIWGTVALAQQHHKQDSTFALQQQEKARGQLQWEAANRNATATATRGPIVDDDDGFSPRGWE